jgi:uncharacterized membrane protein YkvA (DUF1232 family)
MDDKKIADILTVEDTQGQREQESRVRAKFFETLRRAAQYVPFIEDLVAAYYCALDPKTPTRVRGTLLAALAYFVLPFDFVPDFIAIIGFGDDLAVLAAAITAVRSHMTEAHYAAARETLGNEAETAGTASTF